MAVQRNAGGGKKHASAKVRRKRRLRPPWGNLLGGKPLKSHGYIFDRKIDREDTSRRLQYVRMLRLKEHYGVEGGDYEYPFKGVGGYEWWPWYRLALAIASDLDDSLKIVDASPPGKTARRWRGLEGMLLLEFVDLWHQHKPKESVRWCLQQVQKIDPEGFGRFTLRELTVRYSEAKKYHRNNEAARNRTRSS